MEILNKISKLDRKQRGAIFVGFELGRLLKNIHPEIANLYREGKSIYQIVEGLKIQSKHQVTIDVAVTGVKKAISGHDGSLNIKAYTGLIPSKEERNDLAGEHKRKSALGEVNNKIGMYAWTSEELRRHNTKNSPLGIRAKGQTPWIKKGGQIDENLFCSVSEIDFAYMLSQNPNYRLGPYTKSKKVAENINELYHKGKKIRTRGAVSSMLYLHRKSLDSQL